MRVAWTTKATRGLAALCCLSGGNVDFFAGIWVGYANKTLDDAHGGVPIGDLDPEGRALHAGDQVRCLNFEMPA